MADIPLATINGSGGALEFAPETLTDITAERGSESFTMAVTPSVFNTILNLSGKFSVTFLQFTGINAGAYGIRLTVDGVVIWNESARLSVTGSFNLLGTGLTINSLVEQRTVNSTLLLELNPSTDTSINFNYGARAIK